MLFCERAKISIPIELSKKMEFTLELTLISVQPVHRTVFQIPRRFKFELLVIRNFRFANFDLFEN